MPASATDPAAPAPFRAALEAIRQATVRPELVVTEIGAPSDIAPHAVALSADVRPARHGVDSVLGTGRFVLFYDPTVPEAWQGPFRVVCFAQAPLETDIGLDPFVADVTWSWLIDALSSRGADHVAASGTATKVLSTGFGELVGQDGAQLELRASWTPVEGGIGAHVAAWGDVLCLLAGLPPAADVVSLLPRHRASRG